MTEIQFLAQFILDESVPADVRKKMLDRIVELENTKVAIQPSPVIPLAPWYLNPIITPFTMPVDTCNHEYPNPWMSITSPSCKKCGKQASNWITTYATGGSSGCAGTANTILNNNIKAYINSDSTKFNPDTSNWSYTN